MPRKANSISFGNGRLSLIDDALFYSTVDDRAKREVEKITTRDTLGGIHEYSMAKREGDWGYVERVLSLHPADNRSAGGPKIEFIIARAAVTCRNPEGATLVKDSAAETLESIRVLGEGDIHHKRDPYLNAVRPYLKAGNRTTKKQGARPSTSDRSPV